MTNDFIQSKEFLETYQWRKVRQEVLLKYKNRCMCCGATPDEFNNVYLNVDHIMPRKTHPKLALEVSNLQILCNACNYGKGNWHTEDWRPEETFIVTRAWIEENRTVRGAFTGAQYKALGLKFCPPKKWIDDICGKRISEKTRISFENAKTLHRDKGKRMQEAIAYIAANKGKVSCPKSIKQMALAAKERYKRYPCEDMKDQILDTVQQWAVDEWILVFKDEPSVLNELQKIKSSTK